MRILITGVTGFIGSNLAVELQREHSVTGLCSVSSGSRENLKDFKGSFLQGDIRTFPYSSLGKFDAILHQAAISDTTVTDRNEMFSVNVEGFRRILDYAIESGCRKVVYASSAATYGKGKVPMRESDAPSPANVYGESKVEMEKVAENYNAKYRELSLVGLRYFNVYGPRETHKRKATSMVVQLFQQISSGKAPRVFKWGEQFRDFIYVKDVVLANLAAMKFQGSGVFNVGTGIPTSFNQVIQILNRALGASRPTDYFDNPYAFYQEQTQAETGRAKSLLGFSCKFTPEQGIQETVKEFQGSLR